MEFSSRVERANRVEKSAKKLPRNYSLDPITSLLTSKQTLVVDIDERKLPAYSSFICSFRTSSYTIKSRRTERRWSQPISFIQRKLSRFHEKWVAMTRASRNLTRHDKWLGRFFLLNWNVSLQRNASEDLLSGFANYRHGARQISNRAAKFKIPFSGCSNNYTKIGFLIKWGLYVCFVT